MNNGKKILIVDNSMEFRLFMKIRLEMSKYNVFEAINGKDGLKAAENIKPDLIITDFSLSDQNGFEFASRIRTNFSTAKIPIFLISSFPLGSINDNVISILKINAHFINPYEVELLFEKIRVFFKEDVVISNKPIVIEERRDEVRFTTFNFASVEIAKSKKLARIKNISRTGISLMLNDNINKGDLVKITFRKKNDEFTGFGKVKWTQQEKARDAVLIGAEIESLLN